MEAVDDLMKRLKSKGQVSVFLSMKKSFINLYL